MIKIYTLVILMTTVTFSVFGQDLKMLSIEEIPSSIEFKGEFLNCTRWIDALGINYLVLSQSKITIPFSAIKASKEYSLLDFNGKVDTIYSVEADYRDKEIYAYHYLQNKDSINLLWKLFDCERDCPYDLTIEYLMEQPKITDLDKDGISETWLIYWLGCRSDLSPLNMKLIMHSGKSKYAIRGTRIIRHGEEPDQIAGGEMKQDLSFKKLPDIIKKYALELWDKFLIEDY